MLQKPIIALDFPGEEEALRFLKKLEGEQLSVKVGMELYYREGRSLLEKLLDSGHDIFLDLKLHDIPNTVYSAMKVLAELGTGMVNVHAAGGLKMMQAALEGLEEGTKSGASRPKLIAVTQLTSTTEVQMQKEQLVTASLHDSVLHYAALANEAGLDGVVCSALEAGAIRDATSPSFLRVTPGIRLAGDDAHDQKRIVTPAKAKELGSTHLVVGRSITGAANPKEAYERVVQEWRTQQ